MKKKTYLIEILLVFILFNVVNHFFFASDWGFLNFKLHPYWLVVLFIPTRYGFVPGVFSGLVAAAHMIYFSLGHRPSRIDIEKMAESGDLTLPVAFIVIGLFLGAVRQKYKDSENKKDDEIYEYKKLTKNLQKTAEAADKARKLLEGRIVGETATVKTLSEAAKKFEELDLQSVYDGCLEILAEYLKVEKASLYLKADKDLMLKSSYGWSEGQAAAGKIPIGTSIMSIVIKDKNIVTVKDILNKPNAKQYESQFGSVLAMIPLRNHMSDVIGVVNIEQIDFFQFNKPNLDLMQIIVDWASRAIENKLTYEKIRKQLIFDTEEDIYSNNYFEFALNKEFIKAKEFNLDLTLGFIKIEGFGFLDENVKSMLNRTVLAYLKRVTSNVEMIFRYRFEGTFALICPLRKKENIQKTFDDFQSLYNQLVSRQDVEMTLPKLMLSVISLDKETSDQTEWINNGLKECRIPLL